MMLRSKPLVSLIVPTLNRGHHVLRAIQSCLDADAEAAGVDVEVIVSDAGSTDGSWEAIEEKYGSAPRVILLQSPPGSGPMENWLNAAQKINGDYVTFVWSDDYIAPHFLLSLVPPLTAGATVAIGRGVEREIDDNAPLLPSEESRQVPLVEYVSGYLLRGSIDDFRRPFSPTCSLFTRTVFDKWMRVAREWAHASPLRQEVMWRRAIGPDQLLYLIAIAEGGGPVWMSSSCTAQFSRHPGAITHTSSRLPFESGYWVSALWFITDERARELLGTGDFLRFAAGLFWYGIVLMVLARLLGAKSGVANIQCYGQELGLIRRAVSKHRLSAHFWPVLALEGARTPIRLARYLLLKGIRKTPSEKALAST